jgi:S-adenosylmethionine decarboxylase
MTRKRVFGYELLLDCYECKSGASDNFELCYNYLEGLAYFIKMKLQAPPSVFRTDEKSFPDKIGLSGWVPLAESSIVIHTLSKENFISIDIYSCKLFIPEKVIKFTKRYFTPKKIESQFVLRGQHYFDAHKK